LHISLLTKDDEVNWNKFIKKSPSSSIFHTLNWKEILENTFGFEEKCLIAKDNEEIIDVLPLFSVKKLFLGEKIVSIPHSGYCSAFLSENKIARNLLIKEAIAMAKDSQVKYLEIRTKHEVKELQDQGFSARQPLYFPEIKLVDHDYNLKIMSKGHRSAITQAKKKGIKIVTSNDIKDLKTVYSIMADLFQSYGSPIFSFNYLKNMWMSLHDRRELVLLVILHKGKLVGGGIFIVHNDQVIYKNGACKKEYLGSRPYNALVWESIMMGLERNLEYLNLGAAPVGQDGLIGFKKNWGASMHRSFFYYLPVGGNPPEIENYFNSFSLAKRIWRHLPRTLVANLGPKTYEWIC
jgi:lipid II:glycine glycyltransferase (peptidoglycan interpeptide bridge formation enzyme)